jgi:hypothetical protein
MKNLLFKETMWNILNPNTVYSVVDEAKIELYLTKAKERYDISTFLDDISVWMDSKRDYITEQYLPFCVLSVGSVPAQVSAFMYGLFVGKAMEKNKLTLSQIVKKVSKENIMKELDKNIDYFANGLFGDRTKEKPKEFNSGPSEKQPGE